MIRIIDTLVELIESEKYTFEEITEKITKVRNTTRLRFLLQDLGNLVKTGRLSKIKGLIASFLNIKLICGENGAGEIEEYGKAIGVKKAMHLLSGMPEGKVKEEGNDLPIVITHCHNEEGAGILKALLESRFGLKNIKTFIMRGLTSFYANDKGLILAY